MLSDKKLYRVTYQTTLLVLAEDVRDAERVGYKFLGEEVKNGLSEVWNAEELQSEDQLRRDERYSLPWGEGKFNRNLTVNDFLAGER